MKEVIKNIIKKSADDLSRYDYSRPDRLYDSVRDTFINELSEIVETRVASYEEIEEKLLSEIKGNGIGISRFMEWIKNYK